jgi:hypothetical protein
MSETTAEVIDVEPESTELVPYEPVANLFGPDPELALKRMAELATPLADVIEKKKLFATISGRRHITAEGWTTLGGMLGVVPVVCWTRPNETGDGYVARVEARTLDGRIVGAAESECSRVESKWKNRDPYAIRSMAQTRAIGRALRAPLGQIVVLAGYEPAAAEEIPSEPEPARVEPERKSPADPVAATRTQLGEIGTLVRSLQECQPETDWRVRAHDLAGAPANVLTRTSAEMLIEKLQAELAVLMPEEDAVEGRQEGGATWD